MSPSKPNRIALVIIESEMIETTKGIPGSAEYVPCIVAEGKSGYHTTNWTWGNDLAQAEETCNLYNAMLGLTMDEAQKIIDLSINLQIREENPYLPYASKIVALAKKYNLNPYDFTRFWQMRFPDLDAEYMETWAVRIQNKSAVKWANIETLCALQTCGFAAE